MPSLNPCPCTSSSQACRDIAAAGTPPTPCRSFCRRKANPRRRMVPASFGRECHCFICGDFVAAATMFSWMVRCACTMSGLFGRRSFICKSTCRSARKCHRVRRCARTSLHALDQVRRFARRQDVDSPPRLLFTMPCCTSHDTAVDDSRMRRDVLTTIAIPAASKEKLSIPTRRPCPGFVIAS